VKNYSFPRGSRTTGGLSFLLYLEENVPKEELGIFFIFSTVSHGCVSELCRV
jgi:hypothetical protein